MCGIGNQDRRQTFMDNHPRLAERFDNPVDFRSGIKFPLDGRGRGRNDIPPQRPILKTPVQLDTPTPQQGLGDIRFGGL